MVKKRKRASATVPVVILCGGMGTRLAEETETKPKPLVEIGGRPILWHIMKSYAARGFTEFVLCLGYKGRLIRDYFLSYDYNAQDLKIELGEGAAGPRVELLGPSERDRWSVTLAETGNDAMTGARVKRVEKYIKADHFMLTYGDGVCDVDAQNLLSFHLKHGGLGTVTGVHQPARFGELVVPPASASNKKGAEVVRRVAHFNEKPNRSEDIHSFINGGYFVFSKKFFDYLSDDDGCVLEREPLERLSRNGQLMMYKHLGFWQCMDTMRDVTLLRELWAGGRAPWKAW